MRGRFDQGVIEKTIHPLAWRCVMLLIVWWGMGAAVPAGAQSELPGDDPAAWLVEASVQARRISGVGDQLTVALQTKGALLAQIAEAQQSLGETEAATKNQTLVNLCIRALAHDGEDGWVRAAQARALSEQGQAEAAAAALAQINNAQEQAAAREWANGETSAAGLADGIGERFASQLAWFETQQGIRGDAASVAQHGTLRDAQVWVEVLSDPAERAWASLGVAEGLALALPRAELAAEQPVVTEVEAAAVTVSSEVEIENMPAAELVDETVNNTEPEKAAEQLTRGKPVEASPVSTDSGLVDELLASVDPVASAAPTMPAVAEVVTSTLEDLPFEASESEVPELSDPSEVSEAVGLSELESVVPVVEEAGVTEVTEAVEAPELIETVEAEMPPSSDSPAAVASVPVEIDSTETAVARTEIAEAAEMVETVSPVEIPADPAVEPVLESAVDEFSEETPAIAELDESAPALADEVIGEAVSEAGVEAEAQTEEEIVSDPQAEAPLQAQHGVGLDDDSGALAGAEVDAVPAEAEADARTPEVLAAVDVPATPDQDASLKTEVEAKDEVELTPEVDLAPALIPVVPNLATLADPAAVLEGAAAGDIVDLEFTTTKGVFTVRVHRKWAPLAAERFCALARSGFYHNQRFFRVVPGFVVQWGIHGYPSVAAAWRSQMLPDEPRTQPNQRGTIAFAAATQPNTRTTQVFINLTDNAFLDDLGFVPFGEITQGMDVVESLFGGHGETPSAKQRDIQLKGNAFLDAQYPELDSIISVQFKNPPQD